jgi:hypothetical protein
VTSCCKLLDETMAVISKVMTSRCWRFEEALLRVIDLV